MRLLNVHTLLLEEFNESKAPPYAILSHTWGEVPANKPSVTNSSTSGLTPVVSTKAAAPNSRNRSIPCFADPIPNESLVHQRVDTARIAGTAKGGLFRS
ncbi:hypothetical protein AFLA_001350 [Aspergillus flavus NRRL3357]|nr:hypothetical protein AFLA_001350 [Aspergillus flavus NRRL3357]